MDGSSILYFYIILLASVHLRQYRWGKGQGAFDSGFEPMIAFAYDMRRTLDISSLS